MIIDTPAIVLKSFSYGETSIITRCFTEKKGKISLIVRGARSKKSSKFSHFQPMSYIDIIYNHKLKNELQTLSKVSFREYWSHILDDLRSVTFSMTILDITEKTLSLEDPFPGLFKILKNVLRSFNQKDKDPSLLFWFYECSLLTHFGFKPNLDKFELPGLLLPDPNSGPNSGSILASLLSGDLDLLPEDEITPIDRSIINNYLWTLLCYHFEGLEKIKSMSTTRKILSK
ncbi:MAG: DNA repair protein RecO [Fidelibacterota bacterium]